MPDKKNFRSNYYEKIGFKSVDIKKSLESILSESVLDKAKLAQFVIKYELPAQYRVMVWKYFLNVSSSNKEAADFVWEQRREQFQVLQKALVTMRRLPPTGENDDETDRPRRQMMSSILALEDNRLPWAECSDSASTAAAISPGRHLQQRKGWEEDFDVVFDLVEDSLTVEDEVETYWLCRNLYKMVTQRKSLLQAQLKEIESYVWRRDSVLAAHLESGHVWRWPSTSLVVVDLLRYAFAGVFRYEAVISLWDKIVAGAAMGEVFVLAEILSSHRSSLMATPSNLVLDKLDRLTREIPIMSQHTLIDRALEVWQLEFGGILQPSLTAPLAGLHSATTSSNPVSLATSLPASASRIGDLRPKIDVANMDRASVILGHLKAKPATATYQAASAYGASSGTATDTPFLPFSTTAPVAGKRKVVTADQLRSYDENGFFVVKGCVSPAKLEKYKRRFQQICTKEVRVDGITVMKDVAIAKAEFLQGEQAVTKIQDFQYDDDLFEYCCLPELVDVVKDIIGPNVMAMHTMLINKPPDPGTMTSRHPMHQDLHYFPFRPADRIICAWTAMEPVTRQNGCLMVVPGTHRGRLLPHVYPEWEGGVNKMYHGIQNFDPSAPRVHLEMDAGDTVFFHPILVHGSGANRTAGFRKAISCHYAASECYYIDVRGTTQENINDEVLEIARKRLGGNVQGLTYEDIWRYRARLVAGKLVNL